MKNQEIKKGETQAMTKPSQTGKTELETYRMNRSQLKIRELSDLDALRTTFRYCMVLLGIRSDNLPSDAQKIVLYNFVEEYLGMYTCEEVRHAFELAVAGRLNVDSNSFQSFDSVFISRIMNSYSSYINKKGYLKVNDDQEPTDEYKETKILEFIKECIIEPYNKSLVQGENLINDEYGVIYGYLERWGFINLTDEQKKEIFETVKETIIIDNIGDKNDRGKFVSFMNGLKGKYYSRAKIKCRMLQTKEFINECIFNERDLSKEIKEICKIQ